MESVRTARVLTCYYRPKPGGFCKRYFRAINALLNEGCEVHYLAVVRFPIDRSKCYFHRFPWPQEKTDRPIFWVVFHVFSPFILIYLGFRWRITHCFAFGTTYGCMLQPLRVIRKIPLALFLRGDPIAHHKSKNRPNWLIRLELFIEGLSINDVNLFSVSDDLGQSVLARQRFSRPRSVITLRNSIGTVEHSGRKIAAFPLRLACVGMLEGHKNQAMAINAIARMKNPRMILSIYGQGVDDQDLCKQVRQLNIAHLVSFKGWVCSKEIWPETDILLMPSVFEGSPNAVMEALGQGVPILASDILPHREILPATNLLPVGDVEAWTIRLCKIGENPERETALLIEAQSELMQKIIFDWDKRVCDAISGRSPGPEKLNDNSPR